MQCYAACNWRQKCTNIMQCSAQPVSRHWPQLAEDADDTLFENILANPQHVLHQFEWISPCDTATHIVCFYVITCLIVGYCFFVFMIAMFKLFYNTIAACQRPVGPLLSNKCMYVCNSCQAELSTHINCDLAVMTVPWLLSLTPETSLLDSCSKTSIKTYFYPHIVHCCVLPTFSLKIWWMDGP